MSIWICRFAYHFRVKKMEGGDIMLKKSDQSSEKKREKEIGKLVKKLSLDEKIAMILFSAPER